MLAKVEFNCDKKLSSIYQNSILTARNKLNLVSARVNVSHSFMKNSKRQDKENELLLAKKSKVKLMREHEINELNAAKEQLKRAKESERLSVRNNSMNCLDKIKKNRKEDM